MCNNMLCNVKMLCNNINKYEISRQYQEAFNSFRAYIAPKLTSLLPNEISYLFKFNKLKKKKSHKLAVCEMWIYKNIKSSSPRII